jgi:hypothetical protein
MKNRKQSFLPVGKKYKREEIRTTIMLDRLQNSKTTFRWDFGFDHPADVILDQEA